MKLHRLAIATFGALPAYREGIGLPIGDIRVDGRPLGDEDSVKNMLMLHSEIALTEAPVADDDGFLLVPVRPRRLCELAIEHLADIVAVAVGTTRTVSSMPPHIAFSGCTEPELQALQSARGLRGGNARGHPETIIDLFRTGLAGDLGDRMVGVGMLAEAVSATSAPAQYLELIRLFENAFHRRVTQVPRLLHGFLATGQGGYERDEVVHWSRIRNKYFHADEVTQPEVHTSDIRLVLARMRQAAYDVVFNKSVWYSPTTDRRNCYDFPVQTTNRNAIDLYITQGQEVRLLFQLFDPFSSWPLSLGPQMKTLPGGWWAPTTDVPGPAHPDGEDGPAHS